MRLQIIIALLLAYCAFDLGWRVYDNYQLFKLQRENYIAELNHIGDWEPEYPFPRVKLGNRLSY